MSGDGAAGIPLEQIVAVYQPDEGRTFFSLEISHLDPDAGQGSSMIMQFSDSEDRDLWSRSIRHVANKARLIDVTPYHLNSRNMLRVLWKGSKIMT